MGVECECVADGPPLFPSSVHKSTAEALLKLRTAPQKKAKLQNELAHLLENRVVSQWDLVQWEESRDSD
jgi:hypothetical protein